MGKKTVATVDKQIKAVQLRRAGLGYDAIAKACGYPNPGNAYRAVQKALRDTLKEAADELRTLEIQRVDGLFLAVWPYAIKGDDLEAVQTCLKVMARRAKMLGLDAPIKAEVDNKHEFALPPISFIEIVRPAEMPAHATGDDPDRGETAAGPDRPE